jgi:Zn-dependent protease with chaperone function
MNANFPPLDQALPGASVKPVHVLPYRHEEPLFWICTYFSVTMWLMMLIFTLGLIIPIMLLLGLLGMFAHSLLIAWLKGNSVKVTAEQFPDLHALYGQTCTRLAMGKQPELYLAQSDGMLNAMATRFMRRDYVVLLSAVVDALADRPQAIKFYMGHELGHIKRKHLSRHWWLWPGMIFPLFAPAYSRAREYTCDRHGFASCDNLDDAKRALAVLVAGPERWQQLNLGAFEAQAKESGGFWMAVNELTADYPWLCKRMMVLENRNAVFPKRSFWAWMIALLSPRMGYGGAIIGFLYWLIIGGLILVLVGALMFSGSSMSMPRWFENNPVLRQIEKIFNIGSDDAMGQSSDEGSKDAAAIASSQDDTQLALAYSRLADVSSAVDDYMDAHKNQAPAKLADLAKSKELDTDNVDYQVLRQGKQSKPATGERAQLLLQTPVDCESCSDGKPALQLRKNPEGVWSCHGIGIKEDVLKKLPFECEPS